MRKKFYISFIVSIIIFSAILLFLNNNLLSADNDLDEYGGELESTEDEILFLMVGVDNEDLDQHKNVRTDTMILSRVNFKSGKISLLSIPRDTRVMVNGRLDKANHAHSYGGIDLTLETVREFLDIDLDYYVKVNYEAVKELVDAIGGVEIDVPRRMKYDDTTAGKELHIDLEEGVQTLDGDQALGFLRWRKNNDGSGYAEGDIGRIGTQQIFVKELVGQTFKLKNIFKIPKLMTIYSDYVDTNIPMKTALKAARMDRDGISEKMTTSTIPGEARTISGISYYVYYENQTREKVEELFKEYLYE